MPATFTTAQTIVKASKSAHRISVCLSWCHNLTTPGRLAKAMTKALSQLAGPQHVSNDATTFDFTNLLLLAWTHLCQSHDEGLPVCPQSLCVSCDDVTTLWGSVRQDLLGQSDDVLHLGLSLHLGRQNVLSHVCSNVRFFFFLFKSISLSLQSLADVKTYSFSFQVHFNYVYFGLLCSSRGQCWFTNKCRWSTIMNYIV